jgi:hypothetical protein
MSAGSNASNFGYGNIDPLSNINGQFVNVDNSHSSAPFGSNQISGMNGLPGLSGLKINTYAANGSFYKGGGMKHLKKKINKISRKYKMTTRKYTRRVKRKLRTKYSVARKKRRSTNGKRSHRRRSRKMRGGNTYPAGYSQYENNLPLSRTYSVGAELNPNQLALANPPPISVFSTCNDNYNHNTGHTFPSRGN